MKKICIIGLGNMGKAMRDILSKKGGFELIGCEKEDDVNIKAGGADILILAVKPQSFEALAHAVKVDLSGKLVVSIMAGVGIGKIQKFLKVKQVVRTLPNLALKAGESLTIWKAAYEVSDEEKALVRKILAIFGQEIEVDSEEKISLIGVVSGCGPGFIAYFGEKMAEFLVEHGVDVAEAKKVARQTLIGTGEAIKRENWDLTEMRQKVSSKGGLTEAGIKIMEDNKVGSIFDKVGEAAMKREKELNK